MVKIRDDEIRLEVIAKYKVGDYWYKNSKNLLKNEFPSCHFKAFSQQFIKIAFHTATITILIYRNREIYFYAAIS